MNIKNPDDQGLLRRHLHFKSIVLPFRPALRALLLFPMFYMGIFFIALPRAFAQAQEPLVASLEAYKVTAIENAREAFAKADTALPGDIIEYRATYTNTTERVLTSLSLDIPIPAGLTWIAGAPATTNGTAASPAPGFASIDGKNFVALPLDPGIAPGLVRVLRWNLPSIGPRGVATLALRARVNAEAAPAAQTPAAAQQAAR